jgi:hypothetical protein
MEHLQEILRVWADLHNKPSKSQNEKRIMDDLASLLGRRCGEPCLHKMRVVRAGGELEPKEVEPVLRVARKPKTVGPTEIPVFVDAPVEQFTAREEGIVSFVDAQEEKKSPQSNADPVNVAEVKRGRKAKVKE